VPREIVRRKAASRPDRYPVRRFSASPPLPRTDFRSDRRTTIFRSAVFPISRMSKLRSRESYVLIGSSSPRASFCRFGSETHARRISRSLVARGVARVAELLEELVPALSRRRKVLSTRSPIRRRRRIRARRGNLIAPGLIDKKNERNGRRAALENSEARLNTHVWRISRAPFGSARGRAFDRRVALINSQQITRREHGRAGGAASAGSEAGRRF